MNHTATTLQELHDEFTEKVNFAVAEGRDDLVQALAVEFTTAIVTAEPVAAAACLPGAA